MLWCTVLAVVATLIWMALTVGNPFPPHTVVMATGPEGSGLGEYGRRYQQIFRRAGVELRLRRTAGGVENLALLRDPRAGVSVAFVENGLTNRDESPDLVALGTVTVEPLWMFFREQHGTTVRQRLLGKRISIEPEGSATRFLVRRLLALNGIEETSLQLLDLSPEASAAALLRGDIDGAMMLTSWQSPAVRELMLADGIVLENHPRADAYVAQFPSLEKVVLPTGVADLARNIPPTDVQLLAVESSLVVRGDLHPAMQYLLLEAASEIHGEPGLFRRAGQFPAAAAIGLPLSAQARVYYRSGRPFVYRYLPVWIAGLAERLWIVIIPLFAVVFPVAHFVPILFGYVTERRIFKLYGELWFVERALDTPTPAVPLGDLAATLDELRRRANRLRVPLGYAQRLFILKSHIALAQQRIEKLHPAAGADTE